MNTIMSKKPNAIAEVRGSNEYPDIMGMVRFYQLGYGVIVATEVVGLPFSYDVCMSPVFGYHIHSGSSCTGNMEDPFADSVSHYNPGDCDHPFHAGDLPPLFGNDGYALSIFMTNRFCVDEIIGQTIIIHAHPDDFHSQPAGDAGLKIACGKIKCGKK